MTAVSMLRDVWALGGLVGRVVTRWWTGGGRPVAPNQRCLTGWLGVGWRRDVWPGLVRYSLRRQRTNAGWRVYVHRFATTDSEVHNHPWAWSCSWLVAGSYVEVYADACDPEAPCPCGPFRRRVVRWVNFIPRRRWHAVTEFTGRGGQKRVWTLFVCGPSVDASHSGGQ